MGSHRAERPSTRRRSGVGETPSTYVGRRVRVEPAPAAPAPPTVDWSALTAELPQVPEARTATPRASEPGKRRAVKASARPKDRLRARSAVPVLAGVATLAVAVGGALTTATSPGFVGDAPRMAVANAQTGSVGSGTYDALGRTGALSRDSDRDALDDASDSELVEEAEAQAEQRNDRLGELAEAAETEAKEISLNRWVLPVDPSVYRLTSTFGECSALWSACHTGLDMAAPSGTEIASVANGVVTFAGDDGAYGYKVVVTLEDGTEIWYAHQTSFAVSEGDSVVGGQLIGYVGSTGNTTGPHLHIEVRPGGGDPVDPYEAMVAHGLAP